MKFLSDDMRQIIEHLRNGARLIGPVTVFRATGHGDRPWGFSDGRRANKISVDALAARGLIVISDDGSAHEAILAGETGSPFSVSGTQGLFPKEAAFGATIGVA
jgi:hypothetical protein